MHKFTNEELNKINFGHNKYLNPIGLIGSQIHFSWTGYTVEDGLE